MSKYKIALDDGHGMNTAGKRTPTLSNGTIMRENEFNSAVVNYLEEELKRCGFDTVLVAPEIDDVALSTRVNRANNAAANIYVSIHANAFDGSFAGSNPEGVEVFYYKNSLQGKRLAEDILKQLIQGTQQVNRGIKTDTFYVLKNTKMPAILVEAGFMDNPRESNLLISDSFRREVAREVAIGICNYFKVTYIAKPKVVENKKLYCVQCGAFKNKSNAEDYREDIVKKGYQAFVKQVDGLHKVQVGAFSVKANAERLSKELAAKGISNFIV